MMPDFPCSFSEKIRSCLINVRHNTSFVVINLPRNICLCLDQGYRFESPRSYSPADAAN